MCRKIVFFLWHFLFIYILTDSDPMDTSLLPKTRSGRRVYPPLAWYANQRINVMSNGAVEVTPVTGGDECSPLGVSIIHFKASQVW